MNPKPEKDDQEFFLKIMELVLEKYEPVKVLRDADMYLTSPEVHDLLQEFYPGDYSVRLVVELLEKSGFVFVESGSFRFTWLFKKVNDGKSAPLPALPAGGQPEG